MASCNFEKNRGAVETKAKLRHNGKDTRLKDKHKNVHINKQRTGGNLAIKGLSYSECCEVYDNYIRELDSKPKANKRKDRVTSIGIEIPVPKELKQNDFEAWFRSCYAVIAQQYGERTVLEGYFHVDEVHEYVNARTHEKVLSREHAHFVCVPEVNGKLNAKQFTSRANIVKLNKAIHEMTMRDFGVAFNTCKEKDKDLSGYSVEELKQLSERAEREVTQVQERVVKEVREAHWKLQRRENDLQARESDLNAREADFNRRNETIQAEAENARKIEIRARESIKSVEGLKEQYENLISKVEDILADMTGEGTKETLQTRPFKLGIPTKDAMKLPDGTYSKYNWYYPRPLKLYNWIKDYITKPLEVQVKQVREAEQEVQKQFNDLTL